MPPYRPAEPGMSLADVDTPSLLLDMDAFEQNLATMAAALEGSDARLRGHAKAHKCSEIAKRQIASGAVGVCCQKVSEAAAMVAGGVENVLVTNQIVDPAKLGRLCELTKQADVAVLCDDAAAIPLLNAAAENAAITLNVLVEVDVGAGRCGVEPGDAVAVLAKEVDAAKGLHFAGLQAYHGSAQHLVSAADRKSAIAKTIEKVKASKAALAEVGLDRDWVTGAGTGSFPNERDSGLYTEVQAGSFAFMDADYATIEGDDGNPFATFNHALFLWTTVISAPRAGEAFLDVGHKGHSKDSGLATVAELDGIEVDGQSDEHTKLSLGHNAKPLTIGEKVKLIPGHVDPTFNLHDWVVCVRDDKVEDVWRIDARGPGY
ncbi:MAG: alanine racemase [Rhodospirillaceae bacterium]|nr:alanine racemase [Rhodospirillaceae bacterium]HAA91476.1 alanine racemase [Rhodospirillaceae bacterium]